MAKPGEGRHRRLLQDRDVRRWFDNLARTSPANADVSLRTLGRFLDWAGATPTGFVELPPKKRDDLLSDFMTEMHRKGKAGGYLKVTKRAVGSWLDWNGEKITRRIKVPGTRERPSLREAHIPDQDELRRVLSIADAQARTAIALMAFSGQRPEVLGTYLGNRGLRLSNFPEAKISHGEVKFDQVPTMVMIPEDLSKAGRPYFTFLGPEGCEYLAAYVRARHEGGEAIGRESPIITPEFADKPYVRTPSISKMVRGPMRAAGLKEPPYIWRSYFSSRAMMAEAKGLTRDYREFMMGHSPDISRTYSMAKRLPRDTVEEMREAYEAALEFLETVHIGRREDPTVRMLGLLLQAAGYTAKDIEAMDLENKTEEEVVEIIRRTRGSMAADGNGGGVRQRIISLGELDQALANGWIFRSPLPDGRVVVEALANTSS